ncbi:hypothetical protein FACS189444_3800 [Spirochaetia bacterium]|nr:hypothetical protein FACS189444_3800 [Spirochaetia bacterium]
MGIARCGPVIALLLFVFPALQAQQASSPPLRTGQEAPRRAELIRLLEAEAIPFAERSLFAEYGGFGSSVTVSLPAASASDAGVPRAPLVLAIPLSGKDAGGLIHPFSFDAALAFIQKTLETPLPLPVMVAFLGDEFVSVPDSSRPGNTGLRDICAALDEDGIGTLIYLELFDTPRSLNIHYGAQGTSALSIKMPGVKTPGALAPLDMVRPLPALLNSRGIPHNFAVPYSFLYRLGLAQGSAALAFMLEQEIPAIHITGRGGDGTSLGLSPVSLGELLYEYARSREVFPENDGFANRDTHYALLSFQNRTLFTSERGLVILLLLSWGGLLLGLSVYSIAARPASKYLFRLFMKYCWVVPVFFGLLFALLWGVEYLCSVFVHSGEALTDRRIGLELLTAAALFSVLFPLLAPRKISRKALFYGAAALFLSALGLLLGPIPDSTLSPLWLWSFLCILLGALIPVPFLVSLCAALALLPVGALVSALSGATFVLGPTILQADTIRLLLYCTLALLPPLFMMCRGRQLSRGKKEDAPLGLRLIPRILLLGCSAIILLIPSPLLPVKDDSGEPVRRFFIEQTGGGGILQAEIRDGSLFHRRDVEITLEGRGEPTRFDLSLETDGPEPLLMYDTTMPSERNGDGSSVTFLLGEGPPNPLSARISLPLDFQGMLRAEAVYTRWDPSLDTLPEPQTGNYTFRVIKNILIEALPADFQN